MPLDGLRRRSGSAWEGACVGEDTCQGETNRICNFGLVTFEWSRRAFPHMKLDPIRNWNPMPRVAVGGIAHRLFGDA